MSDEKIVKVRVYPAAFAPADYREGCPADVRWIVAASTQFEQYGKEVAEKLAVASYVRKDVIGKTVWMVV